MVAKLLGLFRSLVWQAVERSPHFLNLVHEGYGRWDGPYREESQYVSVLGLAWILLLVEQGVRHRSGNVAFALMAKKDRSLRLE